MSNTIFIGIDAASKSNSARFIDANGNEISKKFPFPNTIVGAEQLVEKILSISSSNGFTSIAIGSEATSFYDWHLMDFLNYSPLLSHLNPKIYRINAKLIKNFKKSFPTTDKTDPIDALAIAEYIRFGRLPAPYQSNCIYFPLQRLTRYRFHLVKILTREYNYFIAHLFLKFSGFVQQKPLSAHTGATSLAIITEFFSPEELLNLSNDELVNFIKTKGKNHFPNPEEVVDAIKSAARESYRLRPELANSVNIILASILNTIRGIKNAIAEIDKAIANEISAFPNTLQSIKGIGPVFAAGIIAEIGDIKRFHSESNLAKFAGFAWPRNQTGEFEGEERRLIKASNKYLKYYFVEAANVLRVHNTHYKEIYERKIKEVSKHKHKRALVLIARKLVRLIFALLSKGQLYQTSLHTQQR